MSSKTKDAPERTFTQSEVDKIVSERLTRDRHTRVVSESRVYAPDSPHSWFADVTAAAADPFATSTRAAHDRLRRHGVELAHEIEARSVEGRTAQRIIRERYRVADVAVHESRYRDGVKEVRALVTGGGDIASASGGGAAAFVAPFFVLSEWALFRGVARVFANECHNLPLPPYGMQAYIPAELTTDAAAQQAELAGVTESDPSSGLQGSPVATITGQVTVSQQFRDRAFNGGGTMDAIIARDLLQRLDEKIDVYALNQAIASGTTVTGSATFSIDNLYQDLAKARETLTDTAGTRLRPTHLFTTSDLFSFVTRKTDLNDRPYFQPQFISMAQGMSQTTGADDGQSSGNIPPWSRFTTVILPGGVLWYTDDNIPAVGGNTQLVVSAPDQAVLLLESPDPVFSAFPQTVAGNLAVVMNLRKYVAVIARHASGTAVVSGAAYPTTAV